MSSLADAVDVDEALVCLVLAVDHLLGEQSQILQNLVKLVVCGGVVEVRRLVHHYLTELVCEHALRHRQHAQHRSNLRTRPVDELL